MLIRDSFRHVLTPATERRLETLTRPATNRFLQCGLPLTTVDDLHAAQPGRMLLPAGYCCCWLSRDEANLALSTPSKACALLRKSTPITIYCSMSSFFAFGIFLFHSFHLNSTTKAFCRFQYQDHIGEFEGIRRRSARPDGWRPD